MPLDLVTLIVIVVSLVALWFLFRVLLSLTAAIFRIGCFLLFAGGAIALFLYFFDAI